jgi:hypothetical protein
MKMKILSLTTLILSSTSLLAITSPQTAGTPAAPANQLETVQFSNTAEADKLHRAYRILAYGDHDYKGHRVAAMNQVKKAAELLGVDLSGDDKNRMNQVLSDDELRDARGLLVDILGSAEVKDQKKISSHIEAAIKQIDIALTIH